jgi:hypothetical protein
MKPAFIAGMLLLFCLTGCGGDTKPENEGKDMPKAASEKKTT